MTRTFIGESLVKPNKLTYKTNFLTKVILRLDFAPVAALQAERETRFTDEVKGRFPHLSSAQTSQLQITAGPTGSAFEQKLGSWVWTHHTENKQRSLALSADSLVVDYGPKEFSSNDEFLETCDFAIGAFQRHFEVPEISRLGMRFIDEIDLRTGTALNWEGIVNSNLVLSVKAGLRDGVSLSRSMHQMITSRDDISMIFNYGMHNPDFPSPIARRVFVLDYDAYYVGSIVAGEVTQRLRPLLKECNDMFEFSIEDGLRRIMDDHQ